MIYTVFEQFGQKTMDINEAVHPFKGSLIHEFTDLWIHGFKNASFLRVSRFTFQKGEKQ